MGKEIAQLGIVVYLNSLSQLRNVGITALVGTVLTWSHFAAAQSNRNNKRNRKHGAEPGCGLLMVQAGGKVMGVDIDAENIVRRQGSQLGVLRAHLKHRVNGRVGESAGGVNFEIVALAVPTRSK